MPSAPSSNAAPPPPWQWMSMKPGVRNRPAASITSVFSPAQARQPSPEPTAAMTAPSAAIHPPGVTTPPETDSAEWISRVAARFTR